MTALGMPDSEMDRMMGVGAKRAIGLYRSCAPRQDDDDGGDLEALHQHETASFYRLPL